MLADGGILQSLSNSKWLPLAAFLICSPVFFVITMIFEPELGKYRPVYFEIPMRLAPAFSIGVAVAVLLEFIRIEFNTRKKNSLPIDGLLDFTILCGICLAVMGVLLVLFIVFHNWIGHLLLLILFYCVVCFWDWATLDLYKRGRIVSKKVAIDVRQGSYFLNIPTLITMVLLLIYICIGSYFGWVDYRGILKLEPNIRDYMNENLPIEEIITTGIILFHLVFGAVGYLIVTFANDPAA